MTTLASLSREEREAHYKVRDGTPVPDAIAESIERVRWVQYYHSLEQYRSFLDVCCKDGFASRWAVDSEVVQGVVGIDICEEAIQHANELLSSRQGKDKGKYYCVSWWTWYERWKRIWGMLTPEQRAGAGFDAVLCMEALEHFPEPEARSLVRTCFDVLSPGGRIFLTTPHIDGPFGRGNIDEEHIFLQSPQSLTQVIIDETGQTPEVETVGPLIHATWRKPGDRE